MIPFTSEKKGYTCTFFCIIGNDSHMKFINVLESLKLFAQKNSHVGHDYNVFNDADMWYETEVKTFSQNSIGSFSTAIQSKLQILAVLTTEWLPWL